MEFPNSVHLDEANEILAQLYITTKNYKDALIALDKIKDKSPQARLAYQKVAYFRGIEFFNDRDYDTAIGLFTKAIVNEEDALIRSSAMYWKAEAFYNKGEFEQARKQYRIYFFNPPSTETGMYHTSNYNLGYCHFKLQSYSDANTWFRKYIRKKDETDIARYSDALIRIGDGFFILKDYSNAMSYYDKAIDAKAKATPYCLFQKGMILGIKGNMQGKADAMDNIINNHGSSRYTADALFEQGNALMALDKNKEADKNFKQVIKKYPNSAYAKKALLKSALIQYNLRNDEKALAIYKDVVSKYPSTPEATEALTGVRNLYISMGQPQEYFDYIKNISSVNISNGAQDSITYEAAEQLYLKREFKTAANGFNDYIQKFPNGFFILNASYYKAECAYMSGELDKALEGYLVVTNSSRNIFTEKSLLKAGEILVKNESCNQAIKIYLELEQLADFQDNIISAQIGLMRCYHLMEDPDNTMIYARKLIEGDKISNPTISEANLLYARSAMVKNNLDEAEKHFKIVAKNPASEAGAESKYSLALIYFKKNSYKQSQGECYQVINQVPSYEYWIGKSFILLGDNYLALKDTFQAKHTYKSIIYNYQGESSDKEDLISIAQKKFNDLIEIENQKKQNEILRKEEEFYNAEEDTTETILQPNE
jgi:TolA-binding protein